MTFLRLLIAMITLSAASATVAETAKFKPHRAAGVKDQYIVLLTDDTPSADVQSVSKALANTYKLKLEATWDNVKGFLAEGKEADAIALSLDAKVHVVEQDLWMRSPTSGTVSTPAGTDDLWYLDRLDEVYWDNRLATNDDIRDGTYDRCPTGSTTTAYVIDQPVWTGHAALGGRVSLSVDCQTATCVEGQDASAACRTQDVDTWITNSHGTGVASLLSGTNNGGALAEIISVNVFPCAAGRGTGTTQGAVIAAVDWIRGHIGRRKSANQFNPSIVNHSGYLYPWDANAYSYATTARNMVLATDVPFFTSADNWGTDSCLFGPNQLAYNAWDASRRHYMYGIFVVGATAKNTDGTDRALWDAEWDTTQTPHERGTNLGACVSAFAPGGSVRVATNNPTNSSQIVTSHGTSWSSPLAAAVALRKLHELQTQPYFVSLYDWLQGYPATDKATVIDTVDLPGREAFTVCYQTGNPNYFEWGQGFTAATCANLEARDGVDYEAYTFPGNVTNTSAARMVSWPRACNPGE